MDYLDLVRHLLQVRMMPTDGPPVPPPTPWGYDQAQNQADDLLHDWWQGGALSPYLPTWTPAEFGPRPMDPRPLVVPNEFVGDEDWILRGPHGPYRGM